MEITLQTLCINPSEACVVVLGGDPPKAAYIQDLIVNAATCIAADSGADLALSCGRTPDMLVGDMDSVSSDGLAACKSGGTRIEQYPAEKDYTDGELALKAAAAQNYKACYIVAGFGRRLDHSLANLSTAGGLAEDGKDVVLCYDSCVGYILRADNKTAKKIIKGQVGDTVSILSLTDQTAGINLKGFVYPLVDATLPKVRAWGVSNLLAAAEGEVSLEAGMVLILYNFMV